jgi:hypothetical protein
LGCSTLSRLRSGRISSLIWLGVAQLTLQPTTRGLVSQRTTRTPKPVPTTLRSVPVSTPVTHRHVTCTNIPRDHHSSSVSGDRQLALGSTRGSLGNPGQRGEERERRSRRVSVNFAPPLHTPRLTRYRTHTVAEFLDTLTLEQSRKITWEILTSTSQREAFGHAVDQVWKKYPQHTSTAQDTTTNVSKVWPIIGDPKSQIIPPPTHPTRSAATMMSRL